MRNHWLAAVLTALTIGMAQPLPVSAQEELQLSIDRCILQPEEAAGGRDIPLYVRLAPDHPVITSVEFGLEYDPRCTAQAVTRSRTAKEIGGEPLDITMVTSTLDNFIWSIWASGESDGVSENLLLLNVTLPEDAGYGDCYEVHYREQSVKAGQHIWLNVVDPCHDYVQEEAFSAQDGYILVAPMRGDVNLDRSIDILDVITLNKFLLGSKTLGIAERYAAETDASGSIDEIDSLRILKYVVELIGDLEVQA